MNPLIIPIKSDDKEAVTNLQAALIFLLSNQSLQLGTDTLKELQKQWQQEQQEASYKEATTKLVSVFQQQYGLVDNSGKLDEETATKLNELLKGLGAFDETFKSPAEKTGAILNKLLTELESFEEQTAAKLNQVLIELKVFRKQTAAKLNKVLKG